MATIALQAAGNAILPGAGGIIGAFAGNYIDKTWLIPALFPRDDIQGPRIDSLQLGFASEGAPINVCFGPECKITGTVIWLSALRERIKEQSAGGKGGGQEIETALYSIDIAILWGRADHLPRGYNDGDAATMIRQILFNGNLFYDRDADVVISDSASRLSVTRIVLEIHEFLIRIEMEIRSAAGGPDLTQLETGRDCTTSGFTRAANNGTFRVKRTRFDDVTGVTWAYLKNDLAETEAASGGTKTITQDNDEFPPGLADSITHYPGNYTQGQDPTIVAEDGAVNTPNYRGSAYTVIKDLQLNAFNQRLPSTYEALLQAQDQISLREVLRQLLVIAGRVEGVDFDVSGVSDSVMIRGFVTRGPRTTAQSLQQLMIAYDILEQERGGVLYLFDRLNAEEVEVDPEDLVAHAPGSRPSRRVRVTPVPNLDLPRVINIRYIDPDADYQYGDQKYKRRQSPTERASTASMEVRLDLVMLAEEVLCFGKRLLWTLWANAVRAEWFNPPSYLRMLENDVALVTGDDLEQRRYLVRAVERGHNEIRGYSGVQEHTFTLDFDVAECDVELPDIAAQNLYVPPELEFWVLDIPALVDAHATLPVLIFVTCAFDVRALYAGASLYESTDREVTFGFRESQEVESVIGITMTELLPPRVLGVWDTVNVIDIDLFHGTGFESRDRSQVLAGANTILVGDEIIGYADAVFNATTSRWELSTLLRGLRDTWDRTTHAENDRVVALTETVLTPLTYNLSARGTTRHHKSVPAQGLIDDFESKELTILFRTLQPFAPANAQATRDGSNNLTVTFERRTRFLYSGFSGMAPVEDADYWFEMDVLRSPGGAVIRTITPTASGNGSVVTVDDEFPSAYYDADDITADGLTPGDRHTVKVYMVNTLFGRSKAFEVTL